MTILTTANCNSLRAISSLNLTGGETYFIKSNDAGKSDFYEWLPTSSQNDDGLSCVKPNGAAGTGRWLRVGMETILLIGVGQSNEARADAVSLTVPTGTSPSGYWIDVNTTSRTVGNPNDVLNFTGPSTVSDGISIYDPSVGSLVLASTNPVSVLGENNSAILGTAVRLHELTCNPVVIILRALGSHPLERFCLSAKLSVLAITTTGNEVRLKVNDLRNIADGVLQRVDLVNVGGLNGRYMVSNRSKTYDETRRAKLPVEGTIKLYDENGVAVPIAAVNPVAGGTVQLHHLWNDFIADLAAVTALIPSYKAYLCMAQGEANSPISQQDLFTTTGGSWKTFLDLRKQFVTQIRSLPQLGNIPILFDEAARAGPYLPDKLCNTLLRETANIDERVGTCAFPNFPVPDGSHFAPQFDRGYRVRADALLALERGIKSPVQDDASYRLARQTDGKQGYRDSMPEYLDQEVFSFSASRLKGRDIWNGGFFSSKSSRIILSAPELSATSYENIGGGFSVYVTSTSGVTPLSNGLPDNSAGGKTIVFGNGISFRNEVTGATVQNTFQCATVGVRYRFHHDGPNMVLVSYGN